MTDIKCMRYNSKYFVFGGDKKLYKNIVSMSGGKWLKGTGWVIKHIDRDGFTESFKLAFPGVTLIDGDVASPPKVEEEVRVEETVEEEEVRVEETVEEEKLVEETVEEDDFVPNHSPSEKAIRTVFRARSADKHKSRAKPRGKETLLDTTSFVLNSSSDEDSDSGSDSSADYPARSPGRKSYISSSAIKRVDHANRRLAELSLTK